MASSVNKVILIGNCGRDPELKYTASGMAICNLSIATSKRRKDKSTGESIEETQWHRLVFYDKVAEIAGQYLKKGKSVYIEGEIKYGKYTDKDGVERNTVDIVVQQMQLLGGRDDGDHGGAAPRPAAAPRPTAAPRPQQGAGKAATGFDGMDDDIPFATADASFDMESRLERRIGRARARY